MDAGGRDISVTVPQRISGGSFMSRRQKETSSSGPTSLPAHVVKSTQRVSAGRQSRFSRLVGSVRGQKAPGYNTMSQPLVTDWADPDSYHLQGDIQTDDDYALERSNWCILTVIKWSFTLVLFLLESGQCCTEQSLLH